MDKRVDCRTCSHCGLALRNVWCKALKRPIDPEHVVECYLYAYKLGDRDE